MIVQLLTQCFSGRLKHLRFLWPILIPYSGEAQSDTQLWSETMVNLPFANVYNLESAFTYGTILTEKPRWTSLDFQETLERSMSPHVDLMAAFLYSSTLQNDSLSTREVRPMIGAKFHFTPNSRVLTRLLLRYEERNFLNTETDTWTTSNRGRIRLEAVAPFNKPTMFAGDNLWYGMADAEVFLVMDQQLQERFANRFRIRAAVGYRLSYTWRFELMYTLQESQNEIGTGFTTIDHIIRLRLKYFLQGTKAAKTLSDPDN